MAVEAFRMVPETESQEAQEPLQRARLLARAREHLTPEEQEALRDAMLRGDFQAVRGWKEKIDGAGTTPITPKAEAVPTTPTKETAAFAPVGRPRPSPHFAPSTHATPAVHEEPTEHVESALTPESMDVETLRAVVEDIRDEVGSMCNTLSLVTCEEYTRDYLPLYQDTKKRFFDTELVPEEVAAFALRVQALVSAADAIKKRMLAEDGEHGSFFSMKSAEPSVPVSEVVLPKMEEQASWSKVPAESFRTTSQPITEPSKGAHDIAPPLRRAPERVVPQEISADTLYTPEMDKALDEMLEEWLGSSGFLGIGGASGRMHPEFVALKNYPVEKLEQHDFSPLILKKVSKKTRESIERNIEGWKRVYHVTPEASEDFEHYLRRIIAASMTTSTPTT